MEVYLLPVGPDRYELYCEPADDEPGDDDTRTEPPGVRQRVSDWFTRMLRGLEKEHQVGKSELVHRQEVDRRWLGVARARARRWLAERIAEQRLLWRLRRCTNASLVYPEDLREADAVPILRRMLQRDADRHWRWLLIDGAAFAVSGPLFFFIPGPNLVAYFFAFRVVGHYLSLRGARQGLDRVTWATQPNAALAELRQAIALASPARERRVSEIASRLRLEHLASFFNRTMVPGA